MGFLTSVLGAAVGGAYGASREGSLEDRIAGGVMGAAGGALTGLAGSLGMAALKSRTLWKGAARGAWGGTKMAASVAGGLTRGAMRHPAAAVGLAATGVGLVALAGSGPGRGASPGEIARQTGQVSTGFSAGQGGDSYQEAKNNFINSTGGLVQGLSRGRHGG